MNTNKYQSPIGMKDIFGDEAKLFEYLVSEFSKHVKLYGFELLISPMLEHKEVFLRVGKDTDVVTKEMYELIDKGGRTLVLKPEGTAGTVRAFVQHNFETPWKVWYLSPHYRYERPQKGRYRQHFQLGVEVLGSDDPVVDIEVIDLLNSFYKKLNILDSITLQVNTMGEIEDRKNYSKTLQEYFNKYKSDIEKFDLAEKVISNPIRLLDTKIPDLQEMMDNAPSIKSVSSVETVSHYESLLLGLDALNIQYVENQRLVRGFDYYCRTTFEFITDALDAAQSTIGGGGRYNNLAEEMGGKPTPGIGFGAGIERLMHTLKAVRGDNILDSKNPIFVIGDTLDILPIVKKLRDADFVVKHSYDNKSFKSQMKQANKVGSDFVIIFGEDEKEKNIVQIKNMINSEQEVIQKDDLIKNLKERI